MAKAKAAAAPKIQPDPANAPDFLTNPDFQMAVNAGIERGLEKIMARMAQNSAKVPSAAEGDPTEDAGLRFARTLALTMAEIADQGTNRKRVAPEILSARAEARVRMTDLLRQAIETKQTPHYRLIAKCALNEQLIEPFRTDPNTKQIAPTEIFWTGVPNEAMRPLNDVARGIFGAFMGSIGGITKENADAASNLNVTPGGLVIKGQLNNRRQVSGLPDSNGGTGAFPDGLGIIGANDPRATDVHVLGTIAPPAKQNFSGEARRVG